MSLVLAAVIVSSAAVSQAPAGGPAEAIRVKISSSREGTQLFRVVSEGSDQLITSGLVLPELDFSMTGQLATLRYRYECRAPCDMLISAPQDAFFIAGPGITPSGRFSLLGQGPEIVLRVEPGSAALRLVSLVSRGLGVTAALLGGVTFLLLGLSGEELVKAAGLRALAPTLLVSGGILLSLSVPLFILGETQVDLPHAAGR